jgi:hypothetical protein
MSESQIALVAAACLGMAVVLVVLGCKRLVLLLTISSYVGTALLVLLLWQKQVCGNDIIDSLEQLITDVRDVVSPVSPVEVSPGASAARGHARGVQAGARSDSLPGSR